MKLIHQGAKHRYFTLRYSFCIAPQVI